MTDRDAFTALLRETRQRWIYTVVAGKSPEVIAAALAAYQELKADLERHGLVEKEQEATRADVRS